MAAIVKRSQGLLLLALVLLAFSAIPASINGQSIAGRTSKMVISDNKKAVIHDDLTNGCYHNPNPHYETANFCCKKDGLCWPSLQECMPNCPCKTNCARR